MSVEIIKLEPTYKRETGLFVLSLDNLPLPKGFQIKEKSVICIPAGQTGGNHKHPRQEVFVAFGEDLELTWQDEGGQIHKELMNKHGQLYLFVVPPFLPHAVVNHSKVNPGILVEFADDRQDDVEMVKII